MSARHMAECGNQAVSRIRLCTPNCGGQTVSQGQIPGIPHRETVSAVPINRPPAQSQPRGRACNTVWLHNAKYDWKILECSWSSVSGIEGNIRTPEEQKGNSFNKLSRGFGRLLADRSDSHPRRQRGQLWARHGLGAQCLQASHTWFSSPLLLPAF